jgi:hypothetical protein
MRIFMIWLLGSDGIFLLLYGLSSLLLVPGSVGESYLSTSRMLYGVLPTALGAVSLGCAVWASIARPRHIGDAGHPGA